MSVPAIRLTVQQKLNRFLELARAIHVKLVELQQLVKLKPGDKVLPQMEAKVNKMSGFAKVMRHKQEAIRELALKKKDLAEIERHLDRALAAAELLNSLMDDTLKIAKAAS